jgi:hypothetical protein
VGLEDDHRVPLSTVVHGAHELVGPGIALDVEVVVVDG